MIIRHLSREMRAAARGYPVITLTGPRQAGKTTLTRAVFPRHRYASLEDPDVRAFALEDPRGFLDQFKGPVILDEVQRCPDLFSYIQGRVDRDGRPGRYVLTGSQNFLLVNRVSQTLAGRCAVLRLLPFSRAELTGAPLRDIARVVQSRRLGLPSPAGRGWMRPMREHPGGEGGRTVGDAGGKRAAGQGENGIGADLFETLFTGGYPRIHDKQLDPQKWLANYHQTYLERDVRDLLNIGDVEGFGRFVGLCAGRSGQILNLSSLATDAGISHPTARRWLSILEASFVVYLLRPHHQNFNKRLVKAPKLYFLDTGLLCYLLRIRSPADLVTHAARGPVFETWVVSEAIKNHLNRGVEPDIYFWRDSTGHEVDLLIEEGAARVPIEVKSGQTVSGDFFADIEYWQKLSGSTKSVAGLVYGGDASYKRSGVAVVSWLDWR